MIYFFILGKKAIHKFPLGARRTTLHPTMGSHHHLLREDTFDSAPISFFGKPGLNDSRVSTEPAFSSTNVHQSPVDYARNFHLFSPGR